MIRHKHVYYVSRPVEAAIILSSASPVQPAYSTRRPACPPVLPQLSTTPRSTHAYRAPTTASPVRIAPPIASPVRAGPTSQTLAA